MTTATAIKVICECEREEGDVVACEKCGEIIGSRLVGDESYYYCLECNWVTNL